MALQIADPAVVGRIDPLARLTGLTKTAAVEISVDRLLAEAAPVAASSADRLARPLFQLGPIPEQAHPDGLPTWDDHGLPQ